MSTTTKTLEQQIQDAVEVRDSAKAEHGTDSDQYRAADKTVQRLRAKARRESAAAEAASTPQPGDTPQQGEGEQEPKAPAYELVFEPEGEFDVQITRRNRATKTEVSVGTLNGRWAARCEVTGAVMFTSTKAERDVVARNPASWLELAGIELPEGQVAPGTAQEDPQGVPAAEAEGAKEPVAA